MIENWKKIYRNNLFLLKKIFKFNKPLFFVRCGYAVTSSISTLINVLLPKALLDAMIAADIRQVFYVLGVYGLISMTMHFVHIFYENYNKVSSEKMYVVIINEFLEKGIRLDLAFFDETESYSKFNRAFGKCCNVVESCNDTILSIITSVIRIVMIGSVLLWANVYVFVVVLIFVIANIKINNILKKINYDYNVLFSKMNKQVNYLYRMFYTPSFIRDIKVNVIDRFVFEKKQELNREIIEKTKEKNDKNTKFRVLSSFLDTLEYVLAAFYFAFSVIWDKIAVSDYFTSLNAYQQIKNAVSELLSSYTEFYNNSLFAEDYIDFMQSEEYVTTNLEGIVLKAEDIEKVEFMNVAFSYPNTEERALEDVSFVINKGDKIAVVGKNGAGKTTLIKLLLRLYDPDEGKILINGVNIKEYNTVSLRSSMRTLLQDFAVYAFSIYDNIALGKEIAKEEIDRALKEVELYDKIYGLKNGIQTPITSQLYKEGVELSGGEKQKMAISRIFASNPVFYILDEPTSSLDPYAEYHLYQKLLESSERSNTVIVISHRLTLTHKMTRILVIDGGRIAESGSHEELMEQNGIYAQMYRIQAEKYVGTE